MTFTWLKPHIDHSSRKFPEICILTDCLMETFSHSRLLFPNNSWFGPSWLKTNCGKSYKLSMTLLWYDLHITKDPLFSSELDFDACIHSHSHQYNQHLHNPGALSWALCWSFLRTVLQALSINFAWSRILQKWNQIMWTVLSMVAFSEYKILEIRESLNWYIFYGLLSFSPKMIPFMTVQDAVIC